jgi:hypothetical protein
VTDGWSVRIILIAVVWVPGVVNKDDYEKEAGANEPKSVEEFVKRGHEKGSDKN